MTNRKATADEIKRDAEAIARVLSSPRIPHDIKHALGEAVDVYVDEYREKPAMLAALLTVVTTEEKGGARRE